MRNNFTEGFQTFFRNNISDFTLYYKNFQTLILNGLLKEDLKIMSSIPLINIENVQNEIIKRWDELFEKTSENTIPKLAEEMEELIQSVNEWVESLGIKNGANLPWNCELLFVYCINYLERRDTLQTLNENFNIYEITKEFIKNIEKYTLNDTTAPINLKKGNMKEPIANISYLTKFDLSDLELNYKSLTRTVRLKDLENLMYLTTSIDRNNIMIVGESGVGKSTLCYNYAYLLRKYLRNSSHISEIYTLHLSEMLKDINFTNYAQIGVRLNHIVEILSSNTDIEIIIIIEDFHKFSSLQNAPYDLWYPIFKSRNIKLIASCNNEQWKKNISKESLIESDFCKYELDEPKKEDLELMVRHHANILEKNYMIKINNNVINYLITNSRKFAKNLKSPRRELTILDQACSICRIQEQTNLLNILFKKEKEEQLEFLIENNKKDKNKLQYLEKSLEIDPLYIKENDYMIAANKLEEELFKTSTELHLKKTEISTCDEQNKLGVLYEDINKLDRKIALINRKKTKLQREATLLQECHVQHALKILSNSDTVPSESEIDKLNTLEKKLSSKIFGQPLALKTITRCLKKNYLLEPDSNKPIASFLFMGSSGTGKNFTGEQLASLFYGNSKSLIKFDMVEYKEKHSISKLIGSNAGYIGYEDGGHLSEAMLRKSDSVVVFDNIDQAHPTFFKFFQQVLEDGFIIDSKGRKIFFDRSIVIFTTSVEVPVFASLMNLEYKRKIEIEKHLKTHSIPKDFLNKINEIVLFKSIDEKDMELILINKIKELEDTFKNKSIKIEYSKKTIENIIEKEFKSNLEGVRPLDKLFESYIKYDLVDKIFDNSKKNIYELNYDKHKKLFLK